jgi:hypothetical protein
MEKEVIECVNFRAGPLPALKRALKELGYDEADGKPVNEILLPDGRRVVCETFFDEVNYDNLCVKCIISE